MFLRISSPPKNSEELLCCSFVILFFCCFVRNSHDLRPSYDFCAKSRKMGGDSRRLKERDGILYNPNKKKADYK